MSQKVYVLTNEAMPDLVKIWFTDQPIEIRIRQLSKDTWVPLPFEAFYVAEVENMAWVESQLHLAFSHARINPRKEFFRIAPEQVAAALKLAELKNVTPEFDIVESPEEQDALDLARKRAERFNFEMIKIPVWSILTFKDDSGITCIVTDATKVELNGNIQSLFKATMNILQSKWQYRKSVRWGLYWKYEWETLVERRMRYELGE